MWNSRHMNESRTWRVNTRTLQRTNLVLFIDFICRLSLPIVCVMTKTLVPSCRKWHITYCYAEFTTYEWVKIFTCKSSYPLAGNGTCFIPMCSLWHVNQSRTLRVNTCTLLQEKERDLFLCEVRDAFIHGVRDLFVCSCLLTHSYVEHDPFLRAVRDAITRGVVSHLYDVASWRIPMRIVSFVCEIRDAFTRGVRALFVCSCLFDAFVRAAWLCWQFVIHSHMEFVTH